MDEIGWFQSLFPARSVFDYRRIYTKNVTCFFSQEMWVILRVGWCSSRHRAFWGGLDLRTLDELEAKSPSDVENRTVETVSMLLNAAQISQILSESMKFYEDLPGVNERPLFYASREKSMKRGHDICRSVTSKPEAPPTNAEKQPRVK